MNGTRIAVTALATGALVVGMSACAGGATEAPAPASAPGPAPASYTYRVTGTADPQMISWSFDGSSGSGSGVPFEKRVTAQTDTHSGGSLTAVTATGARGTLTCSITNDATGEVVDTKTAEADGSDYAFASVACGVLPELGTASYTHRMIQSCVSSGVPETQCRHLVDTGVTGG